MDAEQKRKQWSAKKLAKREKRFKLAELVMKAADMGTEIPREKLYEIHDALMH